jgi:shikimate kinase
MSQPFTWLVAFTVPAQAVAAGFVLTDERATQMMRRDTDNPGKAVVLATPNAAHVANLRGYQMGHELRQRWIDSLRDATPHAGHMQAALLQARAILQSPDVIKTGIDVEPTLKAIEQAIAGLIGELP